jgi:hypothetical protein
MMSVLNVASFGLLIGAMGEWFFYGYLFPRFPAWIVMAAVYIPWLTVFTISFCRQPPFGPRPFRYCLMFAMCWYAAIALLAEALNLLIHPAPHGRFPIILARVLMYLGAFSFIVFVRACVALRRLQTKYDS